MIRASKNDFRFYLKPLLSAWGISTVVYSFMLFHFWWGNHDWDFLQKGVKLSSGLFEARFSQFIAPVVLFDGHILPVICYTLSFGLLSLTGILSAAYLKIPQKLYLYLLFALFITLNPHNFVLFYYMYIVISFAVWAVLAVWLLIIISQPFSIKRFLGSSLGVFFILGGYPPVMSFYCTMYMARQIIDYRQKDVCLKKILQNITIFLCHVFVAGILWKICNFVMIENNLLRENWYNLDTAYFPDIVKNIFWGWMYAIISLFTAFSFLGTTYYLPLAITTIGALIFILATSRNKRKGMLLLEIGLLTASQIIFIIAQNAEQAFSRLLYWGRLGLYLSAISIFISTKKQGLKNLTMIAMYLMLFSYINTDYSIMKNSYLGFKGSDQLYARLRNSIEQKPIFNPQKEYVTMVFGQPNFRIKYFNDEKGTSSELLEKTYAFGVNIGDILFFDTLYNPVVLGLDVQSDYTILQMAQNGSRRINDVNFLKLSSEEYINMRLWTYTSAKIGSGDNSVYINDKYLLIALDEQNFYQNRERILRQIKEWMQNK